MCAYSCTFAKVDEIYARLSGSCIYCTFDLRSGYYILYCPESLNLNLPLSYLVGSLSLLMFFLDWHRPLPIFKDLSLWH